MPPPSTTDRTNAIAATARPGTRANRHGLLRAQRSARPERELSSAPAAATAKKATAPSDREPLSACSPMLPPIRCSPRSPRVTTLPVTAAAVHGAPDIAALDTAASSRLERPGSVRVGAGMSTPCQNPGGMRIRLAPDGRQLAPAFTLYLEYTLAAAQRSRDNPRISRVWPVS